MSEQPLHDSVRNRSETKPFLAHLEDLRTTLIQCVAALTVGILIAFPLAPRIFSVLKIPLKGITDDPDTFLRSLEVSGAFMVSLRISFWSGLLMSAPLIVVFIARFVFPGLTRREKDVVVQMSGVSVVLFVFGAMLGYWVTLPVALKVLFGMNAWLGVRAEWTVSSYVAFATQLLIGFGLVFELPVAVLVLGRLGLLSSAQLRDKRRIAIVIALIVGAVLTPGPDVFSQLMMAIPLILLYEICVWVLFYTERKAAPGALAGRGQFG